MDKNKLREIIFGYRTKSGKIFDVILLSTIVISVICVMLDSDKEIHKEYGSFLLTLEWIFTIFFTIEYALRIYCALNTKKYILSFMGIIDLLSILPTYLIGFYAPIGSLIDIRVMRLIRVFRIFKLTPYLRSGHTMQIALRSSRPKIIVFILSISLMVIILGTIMYIIEGQQNGFDNIPKAIYWAVVTLTTVGYGDVVPITTLGKTVAVVIMMLGYAIIAVPTGIVASELTKKKSRERQDKIIAKEDIILEKMKSLEDKIDQLSKK
jgi:voltage-gated potassium channel